MSSLSYKNCLFPPVSAVLVLAPVPPYGLLNGVRAFQFKMLTDLEGVVGGEVDVQEENAARVGAVVGPHDRRLSRQRKV